MEVMVVDMVVMIINLKNNKVIIQVAQTIQTMFMEMAITKTNLPWINIKVLLKIRLLLQQKHNKKNLI